MKKRYIELSSATIEKARFQNQYRRPQLRVRCKSSIASWKSVDVPAKSKSCHPAHQISWQLQKKTFWAVMISRRKSIKSCLKTRMRTDTKTPSSHTWAKKKQLENLASSHLRTKKPSHRCQYANTRVKQKWHRNSFHSKKSEILLLMNSWEISVLSAHLEIPSSRHLARWLQIIKCKNLIFSKRVKRLQRLKVRCRPKNRKIPYKLPLLRKMWDRLIWTQKSS